MQIDTFENQLDSTVATAELCVCSIEDLQSSKKITKYFDKIKDELLLYLDFNGEVKCFSSVCPHLAGEIEVTDENKLRCKWHGLEFDARGVATNCKAKLGLRSYKTTIRNESVFVTYEL